MSTKNWQFNQFANKKKFDSILHASNKFKKYRIFFWNESLVRPYRISTA